MVWTAGFETANGSGNIVYAQHLNHLIMAMRGNYVLDPTAGGLAVTANGTSNLNTTTDDIDIADGVCFNNSTRRNLTEITSIDLSTEYSGLSSEESRFVFIYVNSSGTVAKLAGDAAATGTQLPPNVPENSVILAMVTLTEGDNVVESNDIEDWRIEAPQGMLTNDDIYLNGNDIQLSDGSQITEAEINLLDGLTGTVWTSANDGAGSGLDADTLDGNQGSSYALLSGATFTGGVTINDYSAAYDTTQLTGTVTINTNANYFYSNNVTLISYSATDVNRILFSHRQFKVTWTSSPNTIYTRGSNGTIDTETIVFRAELSLDGGGSFTQTQSSNQASTPNETDDEFGPAFTTNTFTFDGDSITGDVIFRVGALDADPGAAPGNAVDDTINFDNGAAQGEFQVYWQTAFKTP